MKRREFITLLSGAGLLGASVVCAQEPGRVRRVGVIVARSAIAAARVEEFEAAMKSLGWRKGDNLAIDNRLVDVDLPDGIRSSAVDIVASAPDTIVAQSTPVTRALLAATRTIPIVFAQVSDPIGSGFVASFARPGGNATGFTDEEATISGKWLQLLKEAAPNVSRAGLLFNPETAPGRGEFFLGPFMTAGAALGIKTMPVPVHDSRGIETVVAELGSEPGGGLVAMAESFVGLHSSEIIGLAARFRVPAVYPNRAFAMQGGLIAYGADPLDVIRRAAGYVDRILKGAKPTELPVQQPTKFELAVNLQTAKAIGLDVPQSFLARADEVIE